MGCKMKNAILIFAMLIIAACSSVPKVAADKCEANYSITGGDFETVRGSFVTDCDSLRRPPARRCVPASGCA